MLQAFFGNVAKARTVKTILQQCYGDKATVTDELVDKVWSWQPPHGADLTAAFFTKRAAHCDSVSALCLSVC